MGVWGERSAGRAASSGFTLIEMMVTVGILGILASIAIPTFNGYVHKARHAEKYTNIKALYTGASAYFATAHVSTEGSTAADRVRCLPVSPKASAGGGDPAAILTAIMQPPVSIIVALGGALPVPGDFSDPLFRALNFDLNAPSYAGYFAHPSAIGLATQMCEFPANTTDIIMQIGSFSDVNDDGLFESVILGIGSRDGALFKYSSVDRGG